MGASASKRKHQKALRVCWNSGRSRFVVANSRNTFTSILQKRQSAFP